jgi:hypothetical protein
MTAVTSDHYIDENEAGQLRCGETCSVEALERMRNLPIHLIRLRYFGNEERWTLAFYTYSHERYEPCLFPSGDDHGTPEEAFDVGSVYLEG